MAIEQRVSSGIAVILYNVIFFLEIPADLCRKLLKDYLPDILIFHHRQKKPGK